MAEVVQVRADHVASRAIRPARPWVSGPPVQWLAVCVGSAALGWVIAWIGATLGPIAMVAVPVCVIAAIAIFAVPRVGIMAVYASFPLGFVEVPTYPLSLKLVELVILVAATLIAIRRLADGRTPLRWAHQLGWALALLAWTVIATPSALDLTLALKQVFLLGGGLLLAAAVLTACTTLADVRSVVRVLLLVGGGMALYGLRNVSAMRAAYSGAAVQGRADSVFADPNHFGAFAAVILIVAVGLTLGSRTRSDRVLGILVSIASLAGLMMSLSRGAWLGTVAAGCALLYLLPQARRALLFIGVPVVITAALFGAFRPTSPEVVILRERLGTVSALAGPTRYRYDERPAIWAEALREIRLDPWTGQGPGNFVIASATAASLASTVGAEHAHDVLLTVAAEAGLPAAAILVALTVSLGLTVLRIVRRTADAGDRALVAGIGCALVVQLGQGIVDFNFRNAVVSSLMWSLVGLVLVADRQVRRRARTDGSPEVVSAAGELG